MDMLPFLWERFSHFQHKMEKKTFKPSFGDILKRPLYYILKTHMYG